MAVFGISIALRISATTQRMFSAMPGAAYAQPSFGTESFLRRNACASFSASDTLIQVRLYHFFVIIAYFKSFVNAFFRFFPIL